VVSKADELLGDLLQGWPDDQLLMPVLAVQRVVVREVETQHELSWQDAATLTDRVNYSVGVHTELPALSGRCRWQIRRSSAGPDTTHSSDQTYRPTGLSGHCPWHLRTC